MANESVTYTTFGINPVAWVVEKLNQELLKYDVSGIMKERGSSVRVTSMHPFAEVFERVIDNDTTDYKGVFPVVSVSLGPSTDGNAYLGDGERLPTDNYKKSYIEEIKSCSEKERLMYSLITDEDIRTIESFFRANDNKDLVYDFQTDNVNETIHISVWATNFIEYQMLSILVKSLMKKIRKSLKDTEKVNPTKFLTDGDLVNYDFAFPLYGTEGKFEISNRYSSITVYNKSPAIISGIDLEPDYKAKGEDNYVTEY